MLFDDILIIYIYNYIIPTFACQSQSDVLTRQVATEGLSSDEADFEDLGRNADLYIFNQDDRQE